MKGRRKWRLALFSIFARCWRRTFTYGRPRGAGSPCALPLSGAPTPSSHLFSEELEDLDCHRTEDDYEQGRQDEEDQGEYHLDGRAACFLLRALSAPYPYLFRLNTQHRCQARAQ